MKKNPLANASANLECRGNILRESGRTHSALLGRYTCRKPVLVYWESEQRWTSVNGLEVMSMFDEYCHHIYLDDINKKIQAELPEDKTLGFKRQLQFFILGDEKIRIWVPQGELYFALMNVLQMFPLKKMVDDWTR